MRPLSQIEIRNVDQLAIDQFRIPGVVLMENAGRGCAEVIDANWVTGKVVICCGKGNNGGDGFVIARYLENSGWGVKVRLAYPPDRISGDAAIFLAVVQASEIDVRTVKSDIDTASAGRAVLSWSEFLEELKSADLVVDALLGTGLTGVVRSPESDIIDAINAAGRPILAVDLPSGLDCNTGKPLGSCLRATRTATLVTEKLGFDNPTSAAFTGPLDIVDIGLPLALVHLLDVSSPR